MIGRIRTFAARFARDSRGVSALEFAFIAPLLIFTYFGMAELTDAMTLQRRVGHAASSVGDLVAQSEEELDDDAIDDVFAAASKIVGPYSTTPLKLRITSVTGNADGEPRVDWSDDWGEAGDLNAHEHCDLVADLPAGLVTEAGETVIVAEAMYDYDTVIGRIMPNGLHLYDKFYLKPRQGSMVERDGMDTDDCDD